jgi:hypothetical protein
MAEIGQRVVRVGKSRDLLTYTQLVKGIIFQLASVRAGKPFQLDMSEALDRAILASFLGKLCAETYRRGRFMGSALVVGAVEHSPTEGFWALMSDLDLAQSRDPKKRDTFWIEEVAKAHAWYAKHAW